MVIIRWFRMFSIFSNEKNLSKCHDNDFRLSKMHSDFSDEKLKEFICLCKQTYQQTYLDEVTEEILESRFGKDYIDELLNELRSNAALYILLTYRDKLIGYAKLKYPNLDFAFLSKLYILSEFQGKGLGKLLLLKCCEDIDEHNVKKVKLHVSAGNSKAISFYCRFGFQKIDTIEVLCGKKTYVNYVFSANVNELSCCLDSSLTIVTTKPPELIEEGLTTLEVEVKKGEDVEVKLSQEKWEIERTQSFESTSPVCSKETSSFVSVADKSFELTEDELAVLLEAEMSTKENEGIKSELPLQAAPKMEPTEGFDNSGSSSKLSSSSSSTQPSDGSLGDHRYTVFNAIQVVHEDNGNDRPHSPSPQGRK